MTRDTATPDEILALIAGLPLFRGLPAADAIERIAQAARIVVVRRNQPIFASGDPCLGFHVVLAGQVKLAISSERGDEKVIEIVGPGQSFGEAVMFLDKPYIVGAQALTDSRLLFVAKDSIQHELERDPKLIRSFLASLSLRLHHLVDDIENLSLRSGRERVIGFLLNGAAKSAGGEIRLPFRKALLASRLNLTQEHFSRILHQLSEAGLIAVDGSTIRILDRKRLGAG